MITANTKDDNVSVELNGDIRMILNEFYEIALNIAGCALDKEDLIEVIRSIPEEEEDSDD